MEHRLQRQADHRTDLLARRGVVPERNVDPVDDANAYSRAFGSRADRRVVIVPDATHALLRARWFDYQLESDWPAWKKLLLMSLGRRAYEPGALGMIAGWINAQ
ncbi:hypothetical protein [Burkholderia ubonensis]|uniref:hypothetical protein n=1 Tax=Burkholderia ubonensis TaxID=101571 RepID=UPI0018DF1AA1|nr:hypothetical protein [Burkholderia ubonensis]